MYLILVALNILCEAQRPGLAQTVIGQSGNA